MLEVSKIKEAVNTAIEYIGQVDREAFEEINEELRLLNPEQLEEFWVNVRLALATHGLIGDRSNIEITIDRKLKTEKFVIRFLQDTKELCLVHTKEYPLVGMRTSGYKLIPILEGVIDQIGNFQEVKFAIKNKFVAGGKVDSYSYSLAKTTVGVFVVKTNDNNPADRRCVKIIDDKGNYCNFENENEE